MKKKVWTKASSLSCMLNGNFALKLNDYFLANDYWITKEVKYADLIVFSGCGASDLREKMALHEIETIYRLKKEEAPVIVTSCFSKTSRKTQPELFDQNFDSFHVDLSCSHDEMSKLDDYIHAKIPFKFIAFPTEYSGFTNHSEIGLPKKVENQSRFYSKLSRICDFFDHLISKEIKVDHTTACDQFGYKMLIPGTGCKNACSYCSIKFAKGSPKSIPLDQVKSQAKKEIAAGVRGIYLHPDDIGSWGKDLNMHWITLLDELISIDDHYKIGINNLGAYDILEEMDWFINMAKKKRIGFVGIMIQHVHPNVLFNMNRKPIDVKILLELMHTLNKANVYLSLHFIAGFPGETKLEMEAVIDFLSKIPRTKVGVDIFEYSQRKGSDAAKQYAHLEFSMEEKMRRTRKLTMAAACNQRFLQKCSIFFNRKTYTLQMNFFRPK